MTRAPQTSMQTSRLASLLLNTVSHGAQDYRLAPRLHGFRLDVDYVVTREDIFLGSVSHCDLEMGFLARVCFWLTWLFIGHGPSKAEGETRPAPRPYRHYRDLSPNRRNRRMENRVLPIARSTYALGHILLRRWGYKRFVQWLNNNTLISRVRRCFRAPKRVSDVRVLLGQLAANVATPFCAAPLHPD